MSNWVEKKTILNCKQVRFDHNNNIYYLTKNNIYGENLNDKKIFFTMYFEEEVEDFKITKNRLIVQFKLIIKLYNLSDKKEIITSEINKKSKLYISYDTDDVLINRKIIINSKGEIQSIKNNDDLDLNLSFNYRNKNNYIFFGNVIFDKVNKILLDNSNQDYYKIIDNSLVIKFKNPDGHNIENDNTEITIFNSKRKFYSLKGVISYSEKYTIKNNIIYYLDNYKLYTIDLNQKQRRYDINEEDEEDEDQFGVVTDIEIPFNNQDYDSVDISINGNFIIYKHFTEDTFKIFSKERKEESSFEKIGKLFFKKNLFTEDLVTIIDDNNQEKSYNKDILEILFPIIKISLEETQSKKFSLTGFTIEDFDELIDELIESKEISNKELYQFLG